MTPSRPDLVGEVLTRLWRPAILNALGTGPKRYAAIRAELFRSKGRAPGDGYIGSELKELCRLGLVERQEMPGSRRRAWVLTPYGRDALTFMQTVASAHERLTSSILASSSDTSTDDLSNVEGND
jgi:DNA-binding HxlR family transcriptional regulator